MARRGRLVFIGLIFCLGLTQGLAKEDNTKLRWGADPESGAPSVFYPFRGQSNVVGFEVDIVNEIASALGKTPEFIVNGWDGLIAGLRNKYYDIAINTLEVTPTREESISFSRPYLITYEQLVVRADETNIHDLSDCVGKTVGTLSTSLARDILDARGDTNVRVYTIEVNAFNDLRNGRIDAVFLDAPIAKYYMAAKPGLKGVGKPTYPLTYSIAVRKDDSELLKQIDDILHNMEKDGRLRSILERWNLWNPLMADYLSEDHSYKTLPEAYDAYIDGFYEVRDMGMWQKYSPLWAKFALGAWITIKLSITSMVLAMALGMVLALSLTYGPSPLKWSARGYIEIVRGTPLLIQLYFIYYGLPSVGVELQPFFAGVMALGLNYAAFEAENYRAGIQSVPHGQMEAARALGMTHFQAIRHVIVPQATRLVLPPVTNDFISLLKDSSLVSVITIVDLTYVYSLLASTYYDYFGLGILVAVLYFLLGLPFLFLARWAEKRARFSTSKRKRSRSVVSGEPLP